MSEILMKEMDSILLDPAKAKDCPRNISSFLLVDEQENLQVTWLTKRANANTVAAKLQRGGTH